MSLLAELKRRNVIRVGIAYCITAWLLAQVGEFAFDNFGAPEWVLRTVVVVLLMGLPLVLIFAWAFELTPEGIKREREVDRSESITRVTGRKLDRSIIVFLAVALAWFAWDKFLAAPDAVPEPAAVVEPSTVTADPPAAAVPGKSVAVLPFVALSNGPDDEYFADGLTEEILNSLAQLPELLVTARTSAFSFKGQEIPIPEIAQALGVKHVVEGSVRRSGDRLRVTAQLVRAEDAFHLWSQNYDESSVDTIAVQENIAEQIARALDVVLDEQKRETMRQAGLRDVEAFIAYQKGNEWFEKAHGDADRNESLREANRYFDEVIARVPDFAPVYREHADLYAHILNDVAIGIAPEELGIREDELPEVAAAVIADHEAAVKFARTAELRHAAELDLAFISGNWRGLGGRIDRALESDGCEATGWQSIVADAFGYSARFAERAQEIVTCDPRSSVSWFTLVRATMRSGQLDDALRLARQGLDIAPGNWLRAEYVLALAANGQYEDAMRQIDTEVADADVVALMRTLVHAASGDRENYSVWSDEMNATGAPKFWTLNAAAWGGRRETANELAAVIDAHEFGPVVLAQIAVWCSCGAPWDLDATPNFSDKIREGNLAWPPPPAMSWPLKTW